MGKIITVNMQKGGSGKTTTVQTLAGCLSDRGYRCLLVDLDPNANLTFSSNIQDAEYTIYDLMKGQCGYDEATQLNKYYDIIPSGYKLIRADQEFDNMALKNVLDPIRNKYDFILLDTPPSLGALCRNSLIAADYVIIPVEPSFYAYQGLEQLYDTINDVKQQHNPDLQILGLLLVKYKRQEIMDRVLQLLISRFIKEKGLNIFNTFIHEGVAISTAQGLQANVIETDPKSRPCMDYQIFTDEVLEHLHENRLRMII